MQSNSQISTMPNYVVYLYISFMAKHNDLGRAAEKQSANFLSACGYSIIAQNYRYSHFEIDLIAKKEKTIVFVEVKLRSRNDFGHPEDFVNEAQQKRIMLAASHWIAENKWEGEVRFDIIALSKIHSLEHIEDAFFFVDD